MTQSKEFPQYRWVPAKSWTNGRKSGQPSVIVIHTTEGSEGLKSAEADASYGQIRTDGTSSHFPVDQDSTVQCVRTDDEAHTAREHGNDIGIHIEVCGHAAQDLSQWSDAASAGAIEQTARLCVALRKKYGKGRFPLVRLTPAQLRAGQHGFCGHVDITHAFPEDHGDHTDPGPNFPWSKLFKRIIELETSSKPVEASMNWNDKVGLKKYPSRTYEQFVKDVWPLRDHLVGDKTGASENPLNAASPLGLVLALPARVGAIESKLATIDSQAKSNGSGLSALTSQVAALKVQVEQILALLQTPPA